MLLWVGIALVTWLVLVAAFLTLLRVGASGDGVADASRLPDPFGAPRRPSA